MEIKINRLMKNLKSLGEIGRDENNNLTRLAATNGDRLGRDFVCNIMSELELKIEIDKIGNIIAIWETEDNKNRKPIFTGSHIDTVIGAGIYDGCLGILSGLEVIQTLKENNFKPYRPIACCIFTNEEGVRFQPDMMGSLAYAKGIDIEDYEALQYMQRVLEKSGIFDALREKGIEEGDVVSLYDIEFEYVP